MPEFTPDFNREKRFKTRSPRGTLAIAETIAELLPAPRFIILRGDLGAGKTTLVKGWVEALHAGSADDVTSPTFTLVHEYHGPKVHIYHLDLYRLETERELATLGLDEMAATPGRPHPRRVGREVPQHRPARTGRGLHGAA